MQSMLLAGSDSLNFTAVGDANASGDLDWAMIGGIIGGVLALLLIVAIVVGVLLARRRRGNSANDPEFESAREMAEPASSRMSSSEYARVTTSDMRKHSEITNYSGMVADNTLARKGDYAAVENYGSATYSSLPANAGDSGTYSSLPGNTMEVGSGYGGMADVARATTAQSSDYGDGGIGGIANETADYGGMADIKPSADD